MTPGPQGDWTTASLIALDLEGSRAQDHDDEAILKIAVVPITAGQPDMPAAYSTLANPDRTIPRRPWISPGLTTAVALGLVILRQLGYAQSRLLTSGELHPSRKAVSQTSRDSRLPCCRTPRPSV
jgi:hypothetical protein